MAGVSAYRAAVVVLLIVAVGASGVAAYYYRQNGVPVSRASDLTSQLDSYKSQVNALNSQLAQLQATNSQQASQIQQLSSQLEQFQKVSIKTDIVLSQTCPFLQSCSFTLSGPYANFGLVTAKQTTVAVIYWSGFGGTGQQLCSITYALGDISGLTISALYSQDCQGSSATQAHSFTWVWNYT